MNAEKPSAPPAVIPAPLTRDDLDIIYLALGMATAIWYRNDPSRDLKDDPFFNLFKKLTNQS